jgi:hypothetical protein
MESGEGQDRVSDPGQVLEWVLDPAADLAEARIASVLASRRRRCSNK